ncbi:MAG: hypothetical protein ACTHNP_07150 [Solirubrobacterales bacterium]
MDGFASLLRATWTQDDRHATSPIDEYLARAIVSLAASRALQGETGQILAEVGAMASLIVGVYPAFEEEPRRT